MFSPGFTKTWASMFGGNLWKQRGDKFDIGDSFVSSLDKDRTALANYITTVQNSKDETEALQTSVSALDTSFKGASLTVRAHAQDLSVDTMINNDASELTKEYTQAQYRQRIATIAQGKSLSNVRSIIDRYNEGFEEAEYTQETFTQGVEDSNRVLGRYLSGKQPGEATMGGYIGSSILSGIGNLASRALSMGLNMVMAWGVSAAIQGIFSLIQEASKSSEERLSELRTEYSSLTSDIQKSSKTYQDLSSSMDEVIPRYARLSQGVDALGNNMSLNAAEYQEWADLNSQIAEAFPEINLGKDTNGNYILGLSSNFTELNDSLRDLMATQREMANDEIEKNLPDLVKNANQQLDNLAVDFETSFTATAVERLRAERERIEELYGTLEEYRNLSNEERQSIDRRIYNDHLYDTLIEDFYGLAPSELTRGWALQSPYEMFMGSQADRLLSWYETQTAAAQREKESLEAQRQQVYKSLMSSYAAWAQTELDYGILSTEMQNVASRMIGNIDVSKLMTDGHFDNQVVQDYIINNLLKPLQDAGANQQVAKAFQDLFSLSTSDLSFKDYQVQVRDLIRSIADQTQFDFADLFQMTGFQETIRGYRNEIDKLDKYFAEITASDLYELAPSEISRALEYTEKYGYQTWDRLQEALANQTFDAKVDLTVEADGLSKVESALSEAVSATGLSSDSIDALKKRYESLEDYDPARLFEYTANGVNLNREALEKLEDQIERNNKQDLAEKLRDQVEQYNELADAINKAYLAGDIAAATDLTNKAGNIEAEIQATRELIAQYNGLTSAYNKWQQAQSAPSAIDDYSNIGKGYDAVKDLIDRGFYTSDKVTKYLDLLVGGTGDNIERFEQLKKKIDGTNFSIMDFFQYDDSGNITAQGLVNFFNAVHQGMNDIYNDYVQFDEQGNVIGFDFSGEKLDEIVEKFGMTQEAIERLVRAAGEAGFDISWFNPDQNDLENIQTAGDALERLHKLQSDGVLSEDLDIDINLNASSIEEVETELGKAKQLVDSFRGDDGKVDVQTDGAQEAIEVYSQLYYQKQQLEHPAIMDIKVDGAAAETDLGKAIQKVEDFQNALDALNLTELLNDQFGLGIDTEELSKQVQEAFAAVKADTNVADLLGLNTDNQSTLVDSMRTMGQDAVDALRETLGAEESKVDVNVGVNADAFNSEMAALQSASYTATVTVTADTSGFTISLPNTTVTIPVTYHQQSPTIQKPGANHSGNMPIGTAKATGTAFLRGSWGTKRSGRALGGELGPELVVRNGRYFTIGNHGAELFDYQQGDIIFNAEQTEQILKQGKIIRGKRRGSAMADGDAFVSGSGSFHIPGSGGNGNSGNGGNNVAIGGDVNVDIDNDVDVNVPDNWAFNTSTGKPGSGGSSGSGSDWSSGGGGGGSKSSKNKEETWFDKQLAEHQHLVKMDKESQEEYLAWLDKAYQKAYKEQIIELKDFYKYEEEVYEGRKKLFEDWLEDRKFAIEQLTYLGVDSHRLIKEWKGVYETVKAKLTQYLAQGFQITDDIVQELIKELWEAKDEILKIANDTVDGLQDVYKTYTDAAKEWATTGYLSVDSMQAILELGPKYLQFLYDENGQLKINEKTLQAMLAAKADELAAETALAYVKQILIAAENKDITMLEGLIKVNAGAASSTWDLVYATLGLAKSIGTASGISASYFDDALDYVNKLRSLSQTAIHTIGDFYETLNDGYVTQADGLQKVIDYTKQLIKWENEQQIKALKDEIEAYKKIIDAKKESLRLSKEQDDHDKSVAEKLDDIAKLQARIDLLALDDSREAQAERAKLEEELAEKQKDLADEQSDYAYDKQTEQLDKELKDFEDQKNAEIEVLEGLFSSEEKLYQAAIERISGGWQNLYSDLIAWNTEYGNSLNTEITAAWDAAAAAVQRYGSFLEALEGVKSHVDLGPDDTNLPGTGTGDADTGVQMTPADIISQMYANSVAWNTVANEDRPALHEANQKLAEEWFRITGQRLEFKDGAWYTADGERLYSVAKDDVVAAIVAAMKKNSVAWLTADAGTREYLDKMNLVLGERLSSILGQKVERKNGTWYLGDKKLYDIYHTGGIAGNAPTLKQNEVMAILEKGEAVLDARRERGLYKIVDFVQLLSDKLGHAINPAGIAPLVGQIRPIPRVEAPAVSHGSEGDFVFSPSISVAISHSGSMSDVDAKRYGNEVAEAALGKLSEAFAKRGINRIGNAILKES